MKILFFLLCSLFCMHAQSSEELFLKARMHYDQKEYEKALKEYRAIPNKSAIVWSNMGSCAYNMCDYKAALAYWQIAQSTSRNMKEFHTACQNKEKAYEKVNQAPEKKRTERLIHIFPFYYLKTVPISFLQLLFLSVWFIVWFLIIRRKKMGVALILVANALVSIGLIMKYHDASKSLALIAEPTAYVYAGPHKNFHQIGKLDMLTEVIVQEQKKEWYKIHHEKIVGWIPADSIMKA